MKKVGVLLLLLFVLATALLGCGSSEGGAGIGNPVASFKTQVQSNQYRDALETFTNKIYGNSTLEVEATDFLKEFLSTAWQGYMDETVSRSEFESMLQTVERIDENVNKLGWTLKEIQADYPDVAASKEAYQTGVSQMESGDLEKALASFAQVQSVDEKNYNDAQEKYEQVEDLYVKEIVHSAQDNLNTGNYSSALEIIQIAERTVGYQSEFNDIKSAVVTAEFEEKMKALAAENDFATMYVLYNDALEDTNCNVSATMTNLFAEQQQAFRQTIIDRSVTAYKISGYEAAIPIISEGLATLPDDEKLLKYNEMYLSCAPVSLTDLKVIDTYTGSIWSEVYSRTSENDAFGTQYYNCYFYWSYFSDLAYNELLLNGLYSDLSAKIFVAENTDRDAVVRLKIYADGVKVFDTGLIGRQTDAITVDLDVRNVRVIKIEASTDGHCGGGIVIGDTVLTRTLTDADLRG